MASAKDEVLAKVPTATSVRKRDKTHRVVGFEVVVDREVIGWGRSAPKAWENALWTLNCPGASSTL